MQIRRCPHPPLLFALISDAMVRGTSKGSGMDELNLLVQLIGTGPTNDKEFRLNLFQSEEDEKWSVYTEPVVVLY